MADAPENKAGTIGVEDAARLLMVEVRWVQQLAKDGFIEKAERGRYKTVSVVQGYIRFLKESHAKNEQSHSTNRMRDARAKEFELRNAKAEHRLVDMAEVEALFDELATMLRAGMQGVAAEATRDLPLRAKIDGAIDAVFRRTLARNLEAVAALKQTGGVVDADAEAEPG